MDSRLIVEAAADANNGQFEMRFYSLLNEVASGEILKMIADEDAEASCDDDNIDKDAIQKHLGKVNKRLTPVG